MRYTSGLHRGKGRKHRAKSRFQPGTFVPRLEALEGRCVPSVLTVTSAADDPSVQGTLRYDVAHTASGDTINFASSVGGQTITLDTMNGPLDIQTDVTIDASRVGGVTVSGDRLIGVFTIQGPPHTPTAPTVSMKDITVTDGHDIHGGAGILVEFGSNLTLTNCTVENCDAGSSAGGGIENFFNSTLTLVGCIITGNTAGAGAGLDSNNGCLVTATDTIFSNNTATARDGAGIRNINSNGTIDPTTHALRTPAMTLTNCQIMNNRATIAPNFPNDGIGLANETTGTFPDGCSAQLTNCLIAGNVPVGSGGTGVGGGIFNLRGILSLDRCSITGNSNASGGGIESESSQLTLGSCWIGNNSSSGGNTFGGGGILVRNTPGVSSLFSTPLTVIDCTISNNQSPLDGAGVFVAVLAGETATIENCTVENNSTSGSGGGVLLQGGVGLRVPSAGTVNLTNCTVADNTAGRNGGGLFMSDDQVNLINCTVVGNLNWGPFHGSVGAGIANNGSTLNLQNTVVGGNTQVFDSGSSLPDNIAGPFNLVGPNVFQYSWVPPEPGTGSLAPLFLSPNGGTLPLNFVHLEYVFVGPLQDNGGPAVGAPGHTHALDTMAVLPPPSTGHWGRKRFPSTGWSSTATTRTR